MFSSFNMQEKQIFIGNILFIICCAFYLAWWLLAFKPSGTADSDAVKANRLLIPAVLSGFAGIILAMLGILAKTPGNKLFPGIYIFLGGIAAFFILLAVTVSLFKRQPTTELLLIVGWGMLALAEINTLLGLGTFSRRLTVGFMAVIFAAVIISLVCYVLYYHLGLRAGYIDGMIPLLLAALTMAGISCFMVISIRR